MTMLQSIALLLVICSTTAYINQRFLKWPQVLAMNMMSIILALGLIVAGFAGWAPIEDAETFIQSFDFSDLVLHGILGLLLFAGGMFVDFQSLRAWIKPIAALATIGVVLSVAVVGLLLYGVTILLGVELPLLWCFLFGALISPTDPIAALAIVKRSGAPKEMEIKLVGESLFNDGTGVMLFLIILGVITTGNIDAHTFAHELFVAPVGGIVFGLLLGFIATRLISVIDHHPTEILITLALATSSYGFAEWLHVSAPLSVVASGLVIGHRARHHAMSEETRQHLDVFWEGIDEVLNAGLFVLIGLELIVIDVSWNVIILGLAAWLIVLLGRSVGVFGSLLPMHRRGRLGKGTARVMVWGGLRGSISLALALSLPPGPYTSILIGMSFVVVILSSVAQGMTLHRVIPKQIQADRNDVDAVMLDGEEPNSNRS